MHRALKALSSAFASLARLLGRSKKNPLRGEIKQRAKVTLRGAFPCPKGSASEALGRHRWVFGRGGPASSGMLPLSLSKPFLGAPWWQQAAATLPKLPPQRRDQTPR